MKQSLGEIMSDIKYFIRGYDSIGLPVDEYVQDVNSAIKRMEYWLRLGRSNFMFVKQVGTFAKEETIYHHVDGHTHAMMAYDIDQHFLNTAPVGG